MWEILRQSDPFTQWSHYPKGDVSDHTTHSQYFYHAHPAAVAENARDHENGHFHLFLRKKGIPEQIQPKYINLSQRPEGSKEEDICHLIAISMDKHGNPVSLFTTNRWVTGETWYSAADVIQLIDYFNIDHSYPSWPLNLWLSSIVRVYRDEIIALIHQRDQKIEAWQAQYPEKNAYEDRRLEVTSTLVL
ncbi:MAG: hypothetical protein NTV32_10115 [Gammaproteobacteria bacterium]|nr:hypothetical protein [Gammaproteobacteria bacterium]